MPRFPCRLLALLLLPALPFAAGGPLRVAASPAGGESEPANPRPVPLLRQPRAGIRASSRLDSQPVSHSLETDRTRLEPLRAARGPATARLAVRPGDPGEDAAVDLEEPVLAAKTIFGHDDRRRIENTKPFPWRAQCKIYMTARDGSEWAASATLIDPSHALTAGHCVYMHDAGGWVRAIKLIPGLNGDQRPYGTVQVTTVHAFRGWVDNENLVHDAALLTLKRPIGKTTGYLGFGYVPKINGTLANLASYPADLSEGLRQYYDSDKVWASSPTQVYYRMDTMVGTSGGGVYLKEKETGNLTVFAINSWGGETTNGACRINREVFDQFSRWIKNGE